ncbi:uncharacterized protein LOC144079403 [Stigmatopora argus]
MKTCTPCGLLWNWFQPLHILKGIGARLLPENGWKQELSTKLPLAWILELSSVLGAKGVTSVGPDAAACENTAWASPRSLWAEVQCYYNIGGWVQPLRVYSCGTSNSHDEVPGKLEIRTNLDLHQLHDGQIY